MTNGNNCNDFVMYYSPKAFGWSVKNQQLTEKYPRSKFINENNLIQSKY